ncbi:small RNA 2'-O-methyltransferase-like [Anneissia japonica]|uniref:small RNA 2'-O-methyltransferase-like n=1 Tax=Anneissia japonica TaxID=1529436 RepID=UPI0014258FCD|nr:small RNA 2'-O-methyltransferase-like [Anneissia japonica]XP_033097009.1 small RNA 2'-O-methyltransferase-like [Anneissia japonica]
MAVPKDLAEVETGLSRTTSSSSANDCHGDVSFSPPLYQQRYSAVIEVVRKHQASKVIDMGCGECKLLRKLKQEATLQHLIGVDVNSSCLEGSKFIIRPLTTEYLHPVHNKPFVVQLFEGSVANYDNRLSGFDVLAFVEVIEHLHPEVLEKVPETIFGLMKPQAVVITTPNSEFNVLFKNFTGFRHWDHKFEWTRQEFQHWCEQVCSKYPYTVAYSGVGLGPPDKQHLGHCTQIAEFNRKLEESIPFGKQLEDDVEKNQPYILVSESVHPFKKCNMLDIRQRILYEVQYYNNILAYSLLKETDEDFVLVPLEKMLQFPKLSELCSDVEKLREVIKTSEEFQLSGDETAIVNAREYGSEMSSDDDSFLQAAFEDNETCFVEEISNEQSTEGECWD